ncbi:MAG TPA: glycine betaine ABC transporter substrate-binding protein [Alcaligenaceae bacterium]|nr:glycine betaine ABC transporter substrate-binding protein [Alcaligenaceae bacterium]
MFTQNKWKKTVRTLVGASVLGLGLLSTTSAIAESKGKVHIAYVEWASTVASTNVMKAVLEKAGFEVDTTSLTAAAMWQSVASGDADAFLAGWLPVTHEDYYEKLKDQLVDAGVSLNGAKLGLAVPAYSKANSIEDLNEHADSFDGQIIGIDPGAGIQRLTAEVVKEYDLKLRLRDGSDATMTAALGNAIKNKEDIAVTSWTPHWMFARWDLKYLEDPKGVYGGEEQIHTFTRKGLKEDMPEAFAILSNFNWTPEDMGAVMLMIEQPGADPFESAKKWVEDNPELVKKWMETQN